MPAARLPVLWICGPPGAGKTTAGWQIFTGLRGAGIASAYADIDQLGMCYPPPPSDPGRHRMKAANLDALVASYAAAGARCMVVSGVVDPAGGADRALLPRAALTICHLRADPAELRRRLAGRDGDHGATEDDEGDAPVRAGEYCVDTTGLAADEVVRQILSRASGWRDRWPAAGPVPAAASGPAQAGGTVLLLTGATGAGKSAVGFEVYLRQLRAGRHAAYVDVDQVGFCSAGPQDPAGVHGMRARNLAALWCAFRSAGADLLIAVGPVDDAPSVSAYESALAGADVTTCRLHASDAALARRITLRGAGHGWAQPGDPLLGLPPAQLRAAARDAAAAARRLDRADVGAVRVDTSLLTIDAAADEVLARAVVAGFS